MVLAKMIQAANIGPSSRVLDVGTATGYSAAVMAQLAGSVVALEQDEALALRARENLAGLGNVETVTGSLTQGWPAAAPYDVILLNGATEREPQDLLRQLCEGGHLVCVRGRPPSSKAVLYRVTNGQASGRPIFDAAAPVLPGFAATPEFVF
jgi:protein-L-isoaspartate(D-aspartate) O-methyltransferase